MLRAPGEVRKLAPDSPHDAHSMPEPHYEQVDAAAVPRLVEELFAPSRKQPIVCLTTLPHSGATWIDPAELAGELGSRAKVVTLETGDPTWELARAIPERLAVYGGHARIWWPGLSPGSDIYDHPILWIGDDREARRVHRGIVELVRGRMESRVAPGPRTAPPAAGEIVSGTVVKLDARYVLVEFDAGRGLVPVHELVEGLEPDPSEVVRVGQHVRAEVLDSRPDLGRFTLSLAKALPAPWERAAELFEPGDHVHARVVRIGNLAAELELLPGAIGELHADRMGARFVAPSRLFTLGQVVEVEISALDAAEGRLEFSLPALVDPKRLRAPEPLYPGGPPFPPRASGARAGAPATDDTEALRRLRDENLQLERQLQELGAQRQDLIEERTEQRMRIQELKRDLETERARSRELERLVLGGVDPAESEASFRHAVARLHETLYTSSDRESHPLQDYRLGPRFLETVRALEGFQVAKIVEVCVHVLSGRHDAVPGKRIHPLKAGDSGPQRVRAIDGAKGWRCALQVESPQARRLHWWVLRGGTIELASVNLHDDLTVPE